MAGMKSFYRCCYKGYSSSLEVRFNESYMILFSTNVSKFNVVKKAELTIQNTCQVHKRKSAIQK